MRLFGRERDELERPSGSQEGSVSDVLGVASDRIREIVEAAERAVADINAKVQSSPEMAATGSNKISRERLVAELAESLVKRADDLSRDAASLADVLERASSRLGGMAPAKAESVTPIPPKAPVGSLKPVPQVVRPNLKDKVSERFTDAAPVGGSAASRFKRRATSTRADRTVASGSTEGLRLLATQMAVAGSTNEEIEARLRDEFGVEDASELLGKNSVVSRLRGSVGRG